jgi:hypothetical protein
MSYKTLTMFILVPNLHQSIAFSRRCKERAIWTKCHVMHRTGGLALPNTLPCCLILFIFFIGWGFWMVSSTDFKFNWNFWMELVDIKTGWINHKITWLIIVFLVDFLVPHLQDHSTGQQTSSFQIPGQRADVWGCLQGASLYPPRKTIVN